EDSSPTKADIKNSYAQSAPIEHEDSSSDSSTDEDEADWELDEAADALESKKTSAAKRDLTGAVDIPHLIESFIAEHPAPSATARLPCPVIIPQRRPHNKKRGFVRAYAPVLAECGIDSATFMSFLKLFHQASKVWFLHHPAFLDSPPLPLFSSPSTIYTIHLKAHVIHA
ncbi:hypothetical protein LTR16_011159, partial [Cryomyces antarcticus]